MTDPRNIAIWALLALLLGMSALAGVQLTRVHAEQRAHAVTRQQHAEVLRYLAERTARAADAALRAQQTTVRAVAAIDTKHTRELNHAINETDRLRAAVRSGAVRLRIPAVCPADATGSDVSEATPAASLGDAGVAELDPAAGQAVLDLRAGIVRAEHALRALQAYGRAIQE